MREIKTAVVGLGARGQSNLKTVLNMKGINIVSVCDVYADRCDEAEQIVFEKLGTKPFKTTDYKEAINREDVEVVLVFSSWESHIKIAIYAANL